VGRCFNGTVGRCFNVELWTSSLGALGTALPVHDSIRVPVNMEDFIKGVMAEEYEKVIGFEPVIG
jgi:hypothetical protein